MDIFPKGIYDLHVHTGPDVIPRKLDDFIMARRLLAAGMKGCGLKNHYCDTTPRALLIKKQYPQLNIVGGVTLNRSVGGLNPEAVERCAQLGGRMVWFPTMDSRTYRQTRHAHDPKFPLDADAISVLDEDGRLLPQAVEVLRVAASHDMIVGTGHLGAVEGMALVRQASVFHCKIVLTHADNPNDLYTDEEQKKAAELGAYVEHSFFTTYFNRTPIETIARQIRAVGCDRVVLTSDFGQVNSPYPDEGIVQYGKMLLKQGFTKEELMKMMAINQDKLLKVSL